MHLEGTEFSGANPLMLDPLVAGSGILRKASQPRIVCIVTRDLMTLCEALDQHGYPTNADRWLVSDLSLGAWQAHQVATDFLEQLGNHNVDGTNDFTTMLPTIAAVHDRAKDADTLGQLIDSESKGNGIVLAALNFAQRVSAEVAKHPRGVFLLFSPRFGMSWRSENLAFVEFLSHALVGTEHSLIVVAGGDDLTAPPGHWNVQWLEPATSRPSPVASNRMLGLLGLIPGVIAPNVREAIEPSDHTNGCIKLPGERILVDPNQRLKPSPSLRLNYDWLGVQGTLTDSIRAFAQVHGNSYYCDLGLLSREAWRQAAAGSFEIAADFLDRALMCAPTKKLRCRILLDLQGMHIASQRFDLAATVTDPSEELPPEIRGALAQTKGWALTMLGRAEEGNAYLTKARTLLATHLLGTRRLLYLNNIDALSRLKCGDPEGALMLEKEIELELEQHVTDEGRRDWHLTYVNSINQARLYRILGDVDRALVYYGRAFDTTLGVRSESDSVYLNACNGHLFFDHGRGREALSCWVRAALHWVAAQVPEALAPRVCAGILRRRPAARELIAETIAAALREKILTAASAAGVTVSNSPKGASPVFRKTRYVNGPWREEAMVSAGKDWSIIATPAVCSAVYEGPENSALRQLLFTIIRSSNPAIDWDSIRSILVDEAVGQEFPSSLPQVVNMAMRLRIQTIVYNNRFLKLCPKRRKLLELALSVKIGPAVDNVNFASEENAVVTFKRYLYPRTLSALESRFVSQLGFRPRLRDLAGAFNGVDSGTVMNCARHLEEARVIRLDLDQFSPAFLMTLLGNTLQFPGSDEPMGFATASSLNPRGES